MKTKILKATHQGELKIGEIKIPCAVLEDGTRVISEKSIANSFSTLGGGGYWRKRKKAEEGALLPRYVSASYLEPFISEEIRLKLLNPIIYKAKSGQNARGIKAELLPEICDIWLKAREKGALPDSKLKTAIIAEILLRGFAHVGIIALVDEVTEYQKDRDKKELQKILEAYINKEFLPWSKVFPDEFYEQLFRLRGWRYSPLTVRRPQLVGKLTNKIVYDKLPPGVKEELKNKTPKSKSGHYTKRFHQSLTIDIGHRHLEGHLAAVITLMRVSPNWRIFESLFNRAFPQSQQMKLDLDFEEVEYSTEEESK